jgi:hypothetical protein
MNGFIKFGSHRQRDRALSSVPDMRSYYSMHRNCGKGVYWVNDKQYDAILESGAKFTICQKPWNDFMRCWESNSSDDPAHKAGVIA